MRRAFDRLIIFDYSGTLSLEAPAFARPERLLRELEISGLHDLGIRTPGLFWGRVVNPTWEEGSTTTVGYREILRREVERLFPERVRSARQDWIRQAASRFVDHYLEHSRMDDVWRPLLQALSEKASAVLVVATDHYAEATGAIIGFLQDWQIPAIPVTEPAAGEAPGRVLVANSADLGAHKADRRFWEAIRDRLRPSRPLHVLLVDDFGANEQEGDAYAARDQVENRTRQTVALLGDVFGGGVQDFFFRLGPAAAPSLKARRVEEVSRAVDRFLEGG